MPDLLVEQPPSGGCVLKLVVRINQSGKSGAAAFGRLCVETVIQQNKVAATGCSRLRAAVC